MLSSSNVQRLLAACLTCWLAGCGTNIDYVPLNAAPGAVKTKPPEQVEVFTSSKPEKPHVEVGMLESKQQSSFSSDDASAIIAKMRAEAGKHGCDGLVITGDNNETQVSGNSKSVSSHQLKGYKGTCIVYK